MQKCANMKFHRENGWETDGTWFKTTKLKPGYPRYEDEIPTAHALIVVDSECIYMREDHEHL